MQLKNTTKFIPVKWSDMPALLYRSRFIIAIISALLLLFSGCSKKTIIEQQQQNILQQYFEENILNRDFIVNLATDNGADITAQFSGYTFKLTKATLTNGPLTVVNGSSLYTGSWSCNDDYSKLVITLPSSINAFSFLIREWKFTKKTIPVMELAPWGTTEADVLHMERL